MITVTCLIAGKTHKAYGLRRLDERGRQHDMVFTRTHDRSGMRITYAVDGAWLARVVWYDGVQVLRYRAELRRRGYR